MCLAAPCPARCRASSAPLSLASDGLLGLDEKNMNLRYTGTPPHRCGESGCNKGSKQGNRELKWDERDDESLTLETCSANKHGMPCHWCMPVWAQRETLGSAAIYSLSMSVHESDQWPRKVASTIKPSKNIRRFKLQASLWPWTQQSMVAGLLKTIQRKKL